MTRQPYLHDASPVLSAPIQCWAGRDGQLRGAGAEGVYCGDTRIADRVRLEVRGRDLELLSVDEPGGARASYRLVVRTDELGADPRIVLTRERRADGAGIAETVTLASAHTEPLSFEVSLRVHPDATGLAAIKAGRPGRAARADGDGTWSWREADTEARLSVGDGELRRDPEGYLGVWRLVVPPRGRASLGWRLDATDAASGFVAAESAALEPPRAASAALTRLLGTAFADLNSLLLADRQHPTEAFAAAGAPWFFTLFGRDSLITARLLLPHAPGLAEGTLRTLARRQGRRVDVGTAEQPGKILHEVRQSALDVSEAHRTVVIPPCYFGTVDATALWILLLAEARDAGLGEDVVRGLLPNLRAALGWLGAQAAAGGGFLRYVDDSGTGLANQGWKDSGDSMRFADGGLAEGAIALAEVQGYAVAAADRAAELLESLDGDAAGAARWRSWAERLAGRFRAAFWVRDARGAYPAMALDGADRPVDGLASNVGHLLGTGILTGAEVGLVVERLLSPELFSGLGVRTLATSNPGYWPLGYHVGSVWSHDTAMIIDGLLREGYPEPARTLAGGLLRAAEGLGYRLPELFSGEPGWPAQPYPASCRPQAWAAASAAVIARALS